MPSPFEQLQSVFRDVFENDRLVLDRNMTARDLPGWDSLAHVTLLIAIERAFGIRFSLMEVHSLESVGALLDQIEAKTGPRP